MQNSSGDFLNRDIKVLPKCEIKDSPNREIENFPYSEIKDSPNREIEDFLEGESLQRIP